MTKREDIVFTFHGRKLMTKFVNTPWGKSLALPINGVSWEFTINCEPYFWKETDHCITKGEYNVICRGVDGLSSIDDEEAARDIIYKAIHRTELDEMRKTACRKTSKKR